MVWPALTTDFKVNTLGVEKAPPSGQKFEFEKEAVGEVPAMTEESSPAMRGSR